MNTMRLHWRSSGCMLVRPRSFFTAVGGIRKTGHLHGGNPEVIEEGKKRSTEKPHEGWVPEMASDSEAAVKADRGETGLEDIEELQRISLKKTPGPKKQK